MLSDYDIVIMTVHKVFKKKSLDYGTNWRVYRPIAILDQLFIKAKRIRTTTEAGIQKVNGIGDDIRSEFMGIVNYGAMGVIQFEKGYADNADIDSNEAVALYEKSLYRAQNGMKDGTVITIDSFKMVSVSTLNDLILQNILTLKKMIGENDLGNEAVKKLLEIINYAIFALMMLNK